MFFQSVASPAAFVAPAVGTPLLNRIAPASRSPRRPHRFTCSARGKDADNDSGASASPPPSDSDWRAFRARLVRSEAAAPSEPAASTPTASPDSTAQDEAPPAPAPTAQKTNQKGDWAHHVPFLERGMLLLASPKHFDDDNRKSFFADTAVLLLEAGGRGGALGIVLNRPVIGNTFGQSLLEAKRRALGEKVAAEGGMEIEKNEDLLGELAALSASAVRIGGPVGLEAVFVVHGDESLGQQVSPGVHVGPFDKAVERMREGTLAKARFFCGYAGWNNGQLEREVQDGVWIPCACSADVVLHDWPSGRSGIDRVLRLMGGEYAALADFTPASRDDGDGGADNGGGKEESSGDTKTDVNGGAAQ